MSLEISIAIALVGVVLLAVSLSAAHGGDVASKLLADADAPAAAAPQRRFDQSAELRRRADRIRACSVGVVVCVLGRGILCGWSPGPMVLSGVIGMFAGYLFVSRREENAKQRHLRQLEFYLPSVMERIVMAVSSGLDIIPALRESSRNGKDPVSQLLSKIVDLSEHGTPVEAAFETVAKETPSLSVKHAFVHLGLAHRQGGEIVRPLKELSDATQTAYQETVEEQIAKLPVKAVLPLVLTFTGLIVCFLTVPLMQVGSITKKVANVAKQ